MEAHTLGEAAAVLRADLEEIKCALRDDNMHLERVYGAWDALGRLAAKAAKDLGLFIGADACTPVLNTIATQRSVATRLESWRAEAASGGHGRCGLLRQGHLWL